MGERTLSLTMVNRRGLHARASAKFVQELDGYASAVTVRKDGHAVDGRSIMGLLMLAAACGSTIEVSVDGSDADAAAQAITDLVNAGFGEIE
ncbi:MAG: HPr family phosphocarrier protein [Devosia sp.]